MESEKVKEIKKALEYAIDMGLVIGKNTMFVNIKLSDILTLINELESENERLKIVVDIANEREYRKKFIDEWRKEYQKELDKQGNGHIAGFPDFDLVYKLYFDQKDRIAELEKEKTEQLKLFAKGLKYKAIRRQEFIGELAIDDIEYVKTQDIDETLKEFINE